MSKTVLVGPSDCGGCQGIAHQQHDHGCPHALRMGEYCNVCVNTRCLSNAIAEIREACVALKQYAPDDEDTLGAWGHQRRKLRMAIGLCTNVRQVVTRDRAFKALQPAKEK